ncbi:MAG: hypothetical protein MUO82_00730, partial [Candidatus Thermoplasmatota archaeon]|nr:hypothetical protein [Candidatus Thermoplasmatota archaeon]
FQNTEEKPTIFFGNLNVSIPIIIIENISGGISITADIKNIGTADVENLKITARFTGGLILKKNYQLISNYTLKTNQILNLKIYPIIGFGKTTLTILIISDNAESIDIKKELYILIFYLII